MKFWDHQHSARSETRRLLLGFALAVAILVVAVHAALAMLDRLATLNAYWEQAEDRTPFRIGIGLHTGPAVLGDRRLRSAPPAHCDRRC